MSWKEQLFLGSSDIYACTTSTFHTIMVICLLNGLFILCCMRRVKRPRSRANVARRYSTTFLTLPVEIRLKIYKEYFRRQEGMVSNSSTPSQRLAPEAKPCKDLALTCLRFHDAPPSWFAVLYFQIFRVAISSFGSIQILYNQPYKHAVHKALEVHRPHRLLALPS